MHLNDEPTHVLSEDETSNDVNLEQFDTPTHRAAINQLSVDKLDAWLEQIRERRLQTVRKLEAAAKVKADEVRLVSFMKFERQYKIAQRALVRLDEQIAKAEAIIHKCRLLALAAELEVTQEENEDATVD